MINVYFIIILYFFLIQNDDGFQLSTIASLNEGSDFKGFNDSLIHVSTMALLNSFGTIL